MKMLNKLVKELDILEDYVLNNENDLEDLNLMIYDIKNMIEDVKDELYDVMNLLDKF